MGPPEESLNETRRRRFRLNAFVVVVGMLLPALVASPTAAAPPMTQGDERIPTTTYLTVASTDHSSGLAIIFQAGTIPWPPPAPLRFLVDGKPATNIVQSEAISGYFPPGVYEVQAVFDGTATYAPSISAPVTLTVKDAEPRVLYFAEGATGFFQTKIGVVNPDAPGGAPLQIFLYPENGGAPVEVILDSSTRRTIDVNELMGPIGGVSARVSAAGASVAATRRMTWGSPIYGSTLESGISNAWTSWYFAEGATNIFSLFFLVFNPGLVDANITFTHVLEGGGAPVVRQVVVPAQTRRTYSVHDVPRLERAAFSTVIASDVPVVAERAMYLNTSGRPLEGGTAGRGIPRLNKTWSFAEGATGFFHLYLLLGNPESTAASVDVRYELSDGTVITRNYEVPAQSRRTVDVNMEDPQLASTAVAMRVTSTVPIVAERAMWWGTPFFEGSVSSGTTTPGTKWAIGEGEEGGPSGESTFVLVSNGTAIEGLVRFTVVYDDGTNEQREYTLLPNARMTVRIADDFVKARNATFSVIVESLTPGVTITVESAQYQSSSVFGDGGGAATATRIR
jgi:hypothetical protein